MNHVHRRTTGHDAVPRRPAATAPPRNLLLGEVPGGVERLLGPLTGSADPRVFTAISAGRGGESTPETCSATLAPPPVGELACAGGSGSGAQAS